MSEIISEQQSVPLELYIRIVDGQPFEHPILGDNFREAFPEVDVNNLPPEFARFERVESNVAVGVFERAVVRYEWVNGVVKDVWSVVPLSEEEKQALLLENFRMPHPEGWVFDESVARWVPKLNMTGSAPDVVA